MTKSAVSYLSEKLQDLEEHGPKQLYGVYTGIVMPFPDVPPIGLLNGRIKVKLPSIDPLEPVEAWARVAVPMAGLLHGTYFIPLPGTEVLVAFENGDINSPYVIGSLWNGTAPPPLPLPETQVRMIRTPAGNQIVFTEIPPSVTIQSGPSAPVPTPGPTTLNLSAAGALLASLTSITLMVGASSMISITPASIVLQAGGNVISLTPAGILIQGLPGKVPSVLINPAG
jgi:hypothetical protein